MRGFFVTGTGTGIGKTVLSAALMLHLRARGPVRYFKPIQTGIEQDDDTAEVRRLACCSAEEIFDIGVRLRGPVSPHLAARREGIEIALPTLKEGMPDFDGRWIVEGAGGVLVPVNEPETMADLMKLLDLPVVVAASSGLGTINHTLLTLEALRARSLHVAGVVMIGEPNAENREAIERYGKIAVRGEMPRFDPLTPEALAGWAAEGLRL
ncbi:MAG TPA: dethiobiotin synthase [Bryobacteraceae bacterium]|jgi:dethiobiotin synthase